MKALMNIPKTIKVGKQKRSDTYTGELAYIIYIDEKGKVRKETSWDGWRDHAITPEDFDNEATSGFVLNRNGGGRGYSSWNSRSEFIRVFDPRGFEFEISVSNLLFILQECTSSKGKGLEGEFVYAWSGTELILMPTGCEAYKTSLEFSAAKSLKVTKKDMKIGHEYQTKNMEDVVYLGREMHREEKYHYAGMTYREEYLGSEPSIKSHVFVEPATGIYHMEKGFTKLAKKLGTEASASFGTLFTAFKQGPFVSKIVSRELVPFTVVKDNYYNSGLIFIEDSGVYKQKYLTMCISPKYEGAGSNRYGHGWGNNAKKIPWVNKTSDYTLHEVQNLSTSLTALNIGRNSDPDYHITKKVLGELYPGKSVFIIECKLEDGKTYKAKDYAK